AIEDHVLAAREARLDLRIEMVEAIRGEQERHDPLIDHAELPVRLLGRAAPGEDLADEQPDGSFAGLMREVHGAAAAAQPLGKELGLGGRPGAVEALEDDETPCLRAHGRAPGGSMPSRARRSRSLSSASLSSRSSARARR